MSLAKVLKQLNKIADTSSTNEKVKLLKEYLQEPLFKKVCIYAYDKTKSYHIKSFAKVNTFHKAEYTPIDFFKKLTYLTNSTGATYSDKAEIMSIAMSIGPEAVELLKRIVNKDLKAGFSGTLINKALPGTINIVPYCRCSTHKKLSNIVYPAYVQEKADGTFVNVMINKKGQIKFITRNGQTVYKLNKLKRIIAIGRKGRDQKTKHKKQNRKFGILNCSFKDELVDRVYTGELLITRNKKVLSRKEGNGILNKCIKGTAKFADNENVILRVWDSLSLKEFYNGNSKIYYNARFYKCRQFCNYINDPFFVETVETEMVDTEEEAFIFYKRMRKEGKEGAIVKNTNAAWKNTTSTVMCKLKNTIEVELKITGWKPGKEGSKYELCMGSVQFESACGELQVNVGSGFSDEEREWNWDEKIGMIGTVAAESVITSKNKSSASLFLPRFCELRFDRDNAETLKDILER